MTVQEARLGQALGAPTALQEASPDYEAITDMDPSLRVFLVGFEEVIQRFLQWPKGLNEAEYQFVGPLGLEKSRIHMHLAALQNNRRAWDLIVREGPNGKRSFFLDKDHMRVFAAFCHTVKTERSRKPEGKISLPDMIQKTRKALGSSPLKELLHDLP